MFRNKPARRPTAPFSTRGVRSLATRVAAALVLVAAIAGPAHTQNAISVRGGSFTPWQGETGSSAAFQYIRRLAPRHHLGAEFEYRRFEGEAAKVEQVNLEHYIQRLFYRADLTLQSRVTPYLGLGLGAGLAAFHNDRVESVLNLREPGADFRFSSAVLLDVLGVAGVDVVVPRAEWLSFFGEARASYTAQFTAFDDRNRARNWLSSTIDKRETDTSGGISAHAGFRFRF